MIFPVKKPRKKPKPSRRSPIARSGRVKKVNAKRKAKEFARAYGSKERVAFVKSEPCAACLTGDCSGPKENAHTKTGGYGRKSDARFIAPLCHGHHQELHRSGQYSFDAKHRISLAYIARLTEAAWQKHACRGGFVEMIPPDQHQPTS